MTLQEIIKQLSKDSTTQLQVAKVIEVSNQQCTVDFQDGRPLLKGVRLKAVLDNNDNTFLLIPKIGSYVVVSPIMNNNAVQAIVLYSEVEGLELKIHSTYFEINQDGFIMSRQSENLASVLSSLIDAICNITVPTGTGPSGMPINSATFTTIKNRLLKILKDA